MQRCLLVHLFPLATLRELSVDGRASACSRDDHAADAYHHAADAYHHAADAYHHAAYHHADPPKQGAGGQEAAPPC